MLYSGQESPLLSDNDSQHSDTSTLVEWQDQPSAARRQRIFLKLVALARPAHVLALAKRFGYCFVPQFIRTNVFDDQPPKGKEFSTSYLNGLRGMTAIKVFTFHYFMVFTDATHLPYGTSERYTYFTELPIIRYTWTGFTSHIFFCLAGYLTCHKLFILLDKNDQASQAKVLQTVSGSLFRRALRLYLPVFLITLLMTTYIHLGYYEANRPLLLDWTRLFPGDWNETKPEMYLTWYEQLKFWSSEMYSLCNFVNADTFYPLHDQHLWSILAEMRASVHLYGCLIALSQVKRHARLICLCLLVLVYLWFDHWEIWIYLLGAVVAQIDQILTERQQSLNSLPRISPTPIEPPSSKFKGVDMEKRRSLDFESRPSLLDSFVDTYKLDKLYRTTIHPPTAWMALRITGFLIAFYLLSFPIHGARGDPVPGYETLLMFIPEWMDRKDKFYANWGTFILLILIVRSDPKTSRWRKLLSHWIPQYLGKISFAFYLVQQIIQHAFGYLIPHHIWWCFGTEGREVGDSGWISAIAVGWTLTLIATLWMADCWTREVEGRCVKFVKWLETKCFR